MGERQGLGAYWADYVPPVEAVDELMAPGPAVRSHWSYLADAWAELGARERGERVRAVQRALRQSGASYNVYGDPGGGERPWQLDPLPLVVQSQAWESIERGLIQRAELLDRILDDLYGPRRLIAQGLLPPELVYGHQGFMRQAAGINAVAGRHLQLYAADLARGPDGALWVLGDRTQAPSGAGYALENRLVISRVLPSMFRESRVHRLAVFFRLLRERLSALAPAGEDSPTIVLLTPGPLNETYFEHVYLGAYLGYPVVQGGDLTVRDGRVWMKTLQGLQPVHVILRRLDDDYCDPVELREDSVLGVPGLLGAVRAGTVALANPVGCGVVENPGLMPFLPRLCRELLGEDLRLPNIATWWCGQPQACQHVLANLDSLMVKPVARRPEEPTVYGGELTAAAREDLAARIRAEPWRWVGQERMAVSTSPVTTDEQPVPRATVLRSFLVAHEQAFVAMPGGLARVAAEAAAWMVSNQRGGIAKDTWVLASEPVREDTLLLGRARERVARSEPELPSRVADDLYWLGRYAERAECDCRVLRALCRRVGLESPEPADGRILEAVAVLAARLLALPEAAAVREPPELGALMPALLAEAGRAGSLAFTLEALQRSALGLRERMPAEVRRLVQALDEAAGRLVTPECQTPWQAVPELERLLGLLAGFVGSFGEALPRGTAWCFFDSGRRLERALGQLALLRAAMGPPPCGPEALEALLALGQVRGIDGRRLPAPVDLGAAVERLLREPRSRRSVAGQLRRMAGHLAALPGASAGAPQRDEERLVLEASSLLGLADAAVLAAPAARGERPQALDALLERQERLLASLNDALSRRWFGHALEPVSQLTRVV